MIYRLGASGRFTRIRLGAILVVIRKDIMPTLLYPTPEHASAAEAIVEFLTANYDVDAVLLVNSCAARRPR